MSTVDKMLIKGIRSFDPDNKNVITFFKPLTLIVGPNGAGKTTIIECLKLSCTGELPPNSRSGHTFVHDPKVAGETETKGQIKLRFKTAAGKDVKVCLSYRCADMDREIPALMGVSKAVLENVIFVHQDESNWPLQDPSTLKKKFDDIFSATRYTKALEVKKKLHKDQAQEIKTFRLKLENLQTVKDQAYKVLAEMRPRGNEWGCEVAVAASPRIQATTLHENIAQDQEKSDASKSQMEQLKAKIQGIENEILHMKTNLDELRRLQGQISTKATERSTLFTLQQQQYAALSEENEDTDEELMKWQAKFEERIALLETKISKLGREMDDEAAETSRLSHTISVLTREIGKLQAEADAHMSIKQERDSDIKRIFTKHNFGPVPEFPFTNDVAMNLTNRIKARLSDLENDLQEKKKSNDDQLDVLWKHYLKVNARYSEVDGQIQSKIESMSGLSRRTKDKEKERDAAEVELSKINLSRLDERERHLQIEVERKTLALGERDYDLIINQKRTDIFSLEHKIKTLQREKDNINRDADDRVKLGLKKDALETSKEKLNEMVNEHKDKIRSVLRGRLPAEKDMKKEISQAFWPVDKEYNELKSKSLEAEQEFKLVQSKVSDAKEELTKLRKDLDAKRRFLDSKLQSISQISADVDMFPKVLQDAKNKRDEQKKQRMQSASTAERVKALAIESSDAETFLQQLDKLCTIYDDYKKLLEETIPLAEKNLNQRLADESQKEQTFDDLLGVLAQVKMDRDAVEALLKPTDTIDRHVCEIQQLVQEVEDLEYKLDSLGQGVKSLEEIQLELNSVQRARDTLSIEVDDLRDQHRTLNDDLASAQVRWHTVREEKIKASHILDRFKEAEAELVRLAEEKEQLTIEKKMMERMYTQHAKYLKQASKQQALCSCSHLNTMASTWPSSRRQLVLRLHDLWLKAELRSDATSLRSGIVWDSEDDAREEEWPRPKQAKTLCRMRLIAPRSMDGLYLDPRRSSLARRRC
ncbi:DNA repair protein RAD50 [Panicum miliaceum]|uniref:DNA repair protein RAD50 n=1 Tax=Panicum miliaceum TaxID=4540 RepID=A0A3L6QC05_PANMI|nr:DNA repair protein RAD50 [Panicum miliaceum]